jgi:hypothetical protein
MVSDEEREHFRRLAAAERQLSREALQREARRSPGENVEAAMELTAFASSFATRFERPPEVAPIQLWRARQARARALQQDD